MSRAWFKFYGRDFRDGVRDLPMDVVGVYSMLLTLMYEEKGGRIRDHDQRLARIIGCDIRVWKRARATLIEAGKIHPTADGFLSNNRVATEVASAELLSDIRRTSATSSGEVREKSEGSSRQLTASNKRKSRKTKDSPQANDPDLPLYARALPESESDIDTTSLRSVVSSASKPKPSRNCIEIDLPFSETARAFAAGRGFMNGNAEALWERFTAHHAAKGSRFASIDGAWRTWVLNEIKFNGERNEQLVHVNGGANANRAGARNGPRSAASLILQRAADDDGNDGGVAPKFG